MQSCCCCAVWCSRHPTDVLFGNGGDIIVVVEDIVGNEGMQNRCIIRRSQILRKVHGYVLMDLGMWGFQCRRGGGGAIEPRKLRGDRVGKGAQLTEIILQAVTPTLTLNPILPVTRTLTLTFCSSCGYPGRPWWGATHLCGQK